MTRPSRLLAAFAFLIGILLGASVCGARRSPPLASAGIVNDAPALHHEDDPFERAEVLQRISIQDDEIRLRARPQHAQILVADQPAGVDRGGAQHLLGRHPRLTVREQDPAGGGALRHP